MAWDHPRGCGAHHYLEVAGCTCEGSSPRVRGSLSALFLVILSHGIIPAGAGLTRRVFARARLEGDHPRGCGAHK